MRKRSVIRRVISVSVIAIMLLSCVGCSPKVPPYSEVFVEDSMFDRKFYFEQLADEEQLVYKEIYQGIIDHQEQIYTHSIDPDRANLLFQYIVYDFPEIFWADGTATSTTYEETFFEEAYTILEPEYVYSSEERTSKASEIEKATAEILDSVPDEYEEYEKIKYIYEYLINSVAYVEDAPDNQNLYSALVGKETVCAGYAKANQYLLNQLGIFCTYVIGTAVSDGEADSHAWNIVQCNDKYYYVDVTWADPIIEEAETLVQSPLIYDYLCCSEGQLEDTHTIEGESEYPECVSEDLNYYRVNNMFYETVDEQELLNKMYESIDKKEDTIVFKFSNDEVYEQGKKLILEELLEPAAQYLCRRYNLNQVEYYYEENELLDKYIIYWQYQ